MAQQRGAIHRRERAHGGSVPVAGRRSLVAGLVNREDGTREA
jgi:hypothetical protein